jgi:hypothetical protein
MTHRVPVAALVLLLSVVFSAPLFAQAQPAVPAQSPPPAAAKWIAPIKGVATVQVVRGKPRRVGNDVVSILKVKNTASGAIALLSVEEFWYDQKGKVISGDSYKVKRLINPGEIVEVTTKSPWREGMYSNQFMFTHAHGKVEAKLVAKFPEK